MKTADKIVVGSFSVLFILGVTCLLSVQSMISALEDIKNVERPAPTPAPSVAFKMPAEREERVNHYYEGFSKEYSDGRRHPHRQALKLLLSYLASQGECPIDTLPQSIEVDEQIENEGK